MKPLPAFEDVETKKLIKELCRSHKVDDGLIKDLSEVVQNHSGSGRKHDVDADIASCLDRFILKHPDL